MFLLFKGWSYLFLFASLPIAMARIVGYHVDDETCSGLLMNNRTLQVFIQFNRPFSLVGAI